jgi:hypothetical protein
VRSPQNIAFVLLLFFGLNLHGRVPPGGVHGNGIRFSFGPTYGFYTINSNHAQSPSGRMSAMAGFKKEVRCDRNYKLFFLFGVDYFFHGISFKSYYFDQDTLQLYDKTFPYDYSLFMQELQMPLQMKFSFKRESNILFSPYVMIGYHLRYLLPTGVKVAQEGNAVHQGSEDMTFRHPLFSDKMNSCISVIFGWQKNTINNSHAGFFVEAGYRYQFSQYYLHTKYAPSALYMNSSHLVLLLGIKF